MSLKSLIAILHLSLRSFSRDYAVQLTRTLARFRRRPTQAAVAPLALLHHHHDRRSHSSHIRHHRALSPSSTEFSLVPLSSSSILLLRHVFASRLLFRTTLSLEALSFVVYHTATKLYRKSFQPTILFTIPELQSFSSHSVNIIFPEPATILPPLRTVTDSLRIDHQNPRYRS